MNENTERLMRAFELNLREQGELVLMVSELIGGREEHGEYNSQHEALGVISEEWDEFREEIRNNDRAAAVREARQIAATALRFCMTYGEEKG